MGYFSEKLIDRNVDKGNKETYIGKMKNSILKYHKRIIFLVIIISLFSSSCSSTRLFRSADSEQIYKDLNKQIHQLGPEYGIWGSMVVDLNSGDTLLNINTKTGFTPASLTKLFTVAASSKKDLKIQNARLYCSSPIYADSSVDTLYMWGGGFTLEGDGNIDSLLLLGISALKENGISKVNKAIVIEDPTDNETFHPGWTMDDFSGYYASTPSFYSARSNLWQIKIHRNPDTVLVDIIPESLFKPLIRLDESDKFYYAWHYGEYQMPYLQIGLPPQDMVRNIFVPMFQPSYVWAELLKKNLRQSGYCDDSLPLIYVTDMSGRDKSIVKTFTPLSEDSIFTLVLRYSDNFVAGQLLRSLGYAETRVYGRDSGLVALDSALAELGLQKGRDYDFWDGSGMSRYNWVTPEVIAKILLLYHADKRLNQSLATVGGEGTLDNRLGYFSDKIKIVGKSGSMRGVRNFAGFVSGPGDKQYLLVFMVNHYILPSIEIDKVMRRIILILTSDKL